MNRLTNLNHTDATDAVLAFYDFEYDPASRITALTDIDGRTDFAYDDRDQLTGADRDSADARGDENYAYDANGNRLESHLHGSGYVTGPANRLLSDGTFDYEYDDEGNMIRRTEIASGEFREFKFDHRNRLIRVTDFSSGGVITQEVDYVYDALDRRIARTVDADGSGPGMEVTEHSVYDGENVLLDFGDADGGGSVEQPELATRYLFGPQIDQVLAQEDISVGQTRWLLTDHLGTVRDIVGNTGDVLNHNLYDSFGNVLSQSDSQITTRYLFTGRELDTATGLYYYRARFYDANTGLLVSEDVIGFLGGDSNLHRYAANNPISVVDPFGTRGQIYAAAMQQLRSTASSIGNFLTSWHYDRNQYNYVPRSRFEAIQQGWIRLSNDKSTFHKFGEGRCNTKYVSPDGTSEAVYDSSGKLNTTDINGGSFNYVGPDESGTFGFTRGTLHIVYDVIPYYILGNTREETGFFRRVIQTFKKR